MVVKAVLKPKKTIRANDGLGDFEVIEERREKSIIQKPLGSDDESNFDDSD
jgi:hypothetical protein